MALGTILAIGSTALADASTIQADGSLHVSPILTSELQQTWICDRSDNICGLDDPKMLSKPAKFDYDAVLKATPEMKKIVADRIDPNSS